MLQIISGKFFGGGTINEQECDSVLYSNYSWIAPILTSNMQLRPIDGYRSRITAYAVRYTSRYEQLNVPEGKAVLVHPHATPAVHQFRLLACFCFQAFFHEDRNYVETLCRPQARHSEDGHIPSQFVRRYFDLSLHGAHDEVVEFPQFVDKVVGLSRRKFKLFMSCVETFFDALESIETNFDLAYSMFAYLLETLSKECDEYTPQCSDYDSKTREKLDRELSKVEADTASRIRTILLDESHLKLTQRFIDGISGLIDDSFFLSEAKGRTHALPKSQLRQVLRKLYKTRSGYVHELKSVQSHLRHPEITENGNSDLFVWENEPFLSLSGLVRLTHHALRQYLHRQPQITKEDYEWRNELPGIITMQMAPQYWIWQADHLHPKQAHSRFSGVVAHFIETLQSSGNALTDLRALIANIEPILEHANLEQKRSLLGVYILWNTTIVESAKSPNRDATLAIYGEAFDECSIQSFSTHLILSDEPVQWSGDKCEVSYQEYQRRRFKPHEVRLPTRLEIALALEVANRFLDAGNHERFYEWMRNAMLDAAGMPELQSIIEKAVSTKQRLSTRSVLGFPAAETTQQSQEQTAESAT